MNPIPATFAIDDSAILYLALMRKTHTNIYRFIVTLTEDLDPELLQQAADRIHKRFPTIFAGFRPTFFNFRMVPADRAPRVTPDPGLLHTMTAHEIRSCACRIYYRENKLIWEAFHALTDGYGAMVTMQALTAEYLRLRYGAWVPELKWADSEPIPNEVRDVYADYGDVSPARVPGRYSYQLTARDRDWKVKAVTRSYSTALLLQSARQHGVSLTALLGGIMAESIMEIQQRTPSARLKPVRIMVPIDLRRLFPSTTLRNFILYALPTLEPEEASLPRKERLLRFRRQLKEQTTREYLAPQIASNVKIQRSLFYRMVPRALKCFAMRTGYRFFGESNSSITLTNLGTYAMSEEMGRYVKDITCQLTPRAGSPYNCGILSVGDQVRICISRFGREPDLENIFFEKLQALCE